jgi:hypothetical protein
LPAGRIEEAIPFHRDQLVDWVPAVDCPVDVHLRNAEDPEGETKSGVDTRRQFVPPEFAMDLRTWSRHDLFSLIIPSGGAMRRY